MTAPSDDSENIADTEEICGMNALLGLELVEWRDGYARTEIEVGTKHLNHGGQGLIMLHFESTEQCMLEILK